MKITSLQVFDRMCDEGNTGLQMAPLSFVTAVNMNAPKSGPPLTTLTIKIEGDWTAPFMNNTLVGGLFLVDRKAFEETKSRMETAKAAMERQ